MLRIIFAFLLFVLMISCGDKPKVISVSDTTSQQNSETTGIFDDSTPSNSTTTETTNQSFQDDVHTILVKESMPTEKYVYLNVDEGDENYWVAVVKQDVEVGAQYFFKGGLLKNNFYSKEYDRNFEKLYLVSKLVPVGHSQRNIETHSSFSEGTSSKTNQKVEHIEGSITIAELVDNSSKYENQEIILTGECTKVNPNIMGRNWIHLKDGTKDNYDLVVTSNVNIPVGHIVSLKGKVAIDKDFGAGYRYDLIVENGELIR